MKSPPSEPSASAESFDTSADTFTAPAKAAPGGEPTADSPGPAAAPKTTPVQMVLIALGLIAFLYFARPVVLPVFLACVAGMALKPLIRWFSFCHIPPSLSAVVVLCLLVSGITICFFQLSHPALAWVNEAPQRMTQLRQRVLKDFPRLARFSQAAAAVINLGATEEEKKEAHEKVPIVEVKDSRGTSSILNWTGTFLAGVGETLVLLYLLLASGDLFLQKLVRVMPTLHDKMSAVEISHEIQQNISKYLFSVSLINIGLGLVVSGGPLLHGRAQRRDVGNVGGGAEFCPLFWPRCRGSRAGRGRSAGLRHVVERTPAARLVPVAPSAGNEPHHASLARAPLHAQSGGHFCVVDLLDVALGRARRVIVGADPRFHQSRL